MPTTSKPKLNPSQKTAVEFAKGTLLVVAGAGTGKTRVITERIRHLIQNKKIEPKEIVALTFTEKAAGEMLDRVGDVMPLGYEEPNISTFHSFADKILREEGLEIGLDTGYKILSGTKQWLFFKKNLFKFQLEYFRPLGNPTKFISAILKFISRLQDENISPEELQKYADKFKGADDLTDKEMEIEKQKWQELAGVYKKYQELKVEDRIARLDFGDLIIYLIKLLRERPNLLAKYQQQFKHILVDEFQDTNYAQYELIKILFPQEEAQKTKRSLLVVGDDSQSIYKFRGAAVSNILEFREDYANTKMITLTQNYRSNQQILDSAYKVVQNNNPDTLESKLGLSKKLTAATEKSKIKPQALQTETMKDEVELVVQKILKILAKEPNYTYKDFAILTRANNHLDPFVLALKKYGLPYQLVGNRGLYDQEEVRNLIAILKVLVDKSDAINLYRALNVEAFGINHTEISQMLTEAKFQRIPLWEAIRNFRSEKVKNFCETLKNFEDKITKSTPSELTYEIINSIGYLQEFTAEETVENELRLKNLNLFYNLIKNFEIEWRGENNETPTVLDFVEYLELMLEAGDNPAQAEIEDIDTINLLTVHSSKGLEFPVVFMGNLVANRFPTRNRHDAIEIPDELVQETLPEGDPHIQEERRLFYVGMTRAQKYLFLTLAKNYGGKRETKPSGYVGETGLKLQEISAEEMDATRKTDQTGLFGVQSAFREPVIEKDRGFTPKIVSYTQISMYENCPLQYKYGYVLRIPFQPNHALTFGDTIHKTLRDFHTKLALGEKVRTSRSAREPCISPPAKVSVDQLLEMYEKNWDPSGYLSEEHKLERFENGKKILKRYYQDNIDKKLKHRALEKNFYLFIDGTKFFGKIDRIDVLPGKKGDGIEVIDYKTGKAKTQKEVDNDKQLTLYAIGTKEALHLEPEKLSLYFVDAGEKLSTTRTDAQLKEERENVAEVIKKIKSGSFEPKPSRLCEWCNYKEICPYVWKG